MTNLLRAEFIKLLTTKLWWIVGGIWLVLAATFGGLSAAFVEAADLSSLSDQEQVFRFSWSLLGLLLVPVIGVSIATSDTSSRTLGMTLLGDPRRERVATAKGLTALGAGAILGLATGLVALITIGIALASRGLGTEFLTDAGLQFVFAAAIYGALLCLVGFGAGLLINNQTAAIVLTIAFFLVIEQIITLLLFIADAESVISWLPGSAAGQLAQLGQSGGATDNFDDDLSLFSPPVSGLVVLGWGLVLSALGALRLKRSDIT